MSKKAEKKSATPPKKRNPLSLNPLMSKSHAHVKTNKAQRAKDKQALKKEIDNE